MAVEVRSDRVSKYREMMMGQGWVPETGNPDVLGRFVDHEWTSGHAEFGERNRPSSGADQSMNCCVMLEMCAVHAEAVRRGVEETSAIKVKAGNKAELCERFPGAWEDYRRRGGVGLGGQPGSQAPVPQVIGSAIEAAGFGPDLVADLKAKGIYSLENIAAVPDGRAFELLGPRAWDIRKAATEALGRISMPISGTPLRGLSFLSELDIDRLATELNITNLERVAAMTDAECYQMKPNGAEWRGMARQALAVRRALAEQGVAPKGAPVKRAKRKVSRK